MITTADERRICGDLFHQYRDQHQSRQHPCRYSACSPRFSGCHWRQIHRGINRRTHQQGKTQQCNTCRYRPVNPGGGIADYCSRRDQPGYCRRRIHDINVSDYIRVDSALVPAIYPVHHPTWFRRIATKLRECQSIDVRKLRECQSVRSTSIHTTLGYGDI